MRLRFLLSYLILAFMVSGVILAPQADAASLSSILVDIIPENPAPNENTTITLNSYANNLDSVLISWSVDGKIVASGTGKKSFSVPAPEAGGEINVVATITLPDGILESKMTIRSSVMVLLSQATDSYVPPFYRGKALPSLGSEIKIVAMPEIRTASGLTDPKNMTYAWRKDYTNDQSGSGYGKNFFTYINDYLDDSNNISVVASTTDQQYSSEASIDMLPTQPKILFYKNDDSLGTIWQNALIGSHKIQTSEIVEAVPYFVSPREIRNPTLVWNWFINDNRVDLTSFKKNLMPLAVQEGVSGTSVLKLTIENQDKIFQTTSKEISIEF